MTTTTTPSTALGTNLAGLARYTEHLRVLACDDAAEQLVDDLAEHVVATTATWRAVAEPATTYHDAHGTNAWTLAVPVKVYRSAGTTDTLTEAELAELADAWWSLAAEAAQLVGLGVYQSGRSGGWCVFTNADGSTLDAAELAAAAADTSDTVRAVRAYQLAALVGVAAEAVLGLLNADVLGTLADRVRAVRCDVCGGPVDGGDGFTDDAWTACGPVYGNGCDALAAELGDRDPAELGVLTAAAVTVDHHAVDGFTCWWTDRHAELRHRRFLGYSVTEAVAAVVAEANAWWTDR